MKVENVNWSVIASLMAAGEPVSHLVGPIFEQCDAVSTGGRIYELLFALGYFFEFESFDSDYVIRQFEKMSNTRKRQFYRATLTHSKGAQYQEIIEDYCMEHELFAIVLDQCSQSKRYALMGNPGRFELLQLFAHCDLTEADIEFLYTQYIQSNETEMVKQADLQLLLQHAKHIPVQIFHDAIAIGSPFLIKCAIRHQDCPEEIVLTYRDKYILDAIQNPKAEPAWLELIYKRENHKYTAIILENPSCPVELLALEVENGSEFREEIIRNVACPPELLAQILADYEYVNPIFNSQIYHQIAKNPRVYPETLDKLSQKNLDVKLSVVQHPQCSEKTFSRLGKTTNLKLQKAIAACSHTPRTILEQYMSSERWEVRILAFETLIAKN